MQISLPLCCDRGDIYIYIYIGAPWQDFPEGELDESLQPLDLSSVNSWRHVDNQQNLSRALSLSRGSAALLAGITVKPSRGPGVWKKCRGCEALFWLCFVYLLVASATYLSWSMWQLFCMLELSARCCITLKPLAAPLCTMHLVCNWYARFPRWSCCKPWPQIQRLRSSCAASLPTCLV